MVTLDMKGLRALCCLSGLRCSWPRCGRVPLALGDASEKWGGGRGRGFAPEPPGPPTSQKPQAFSSSCKWQPEFRVESASLPLALVQHSSLSE